MMTEERDHLRKRAALQGQVHHATDMVHSLTGRTDQHVSEIVGMFPDHDVVKQYRDAVERLKQFDKGE